MAIFPGGRGLACISVFPFWIELQMTEVQ